MQIIKGTYLSTFYFRNNGLDAKTTLQGGFVINTFPIIEILALFTFVAQLQAPVKLQKVII